MIGAASGGHYFASEISRYLKKVRRTTTVSSELPGALDDAGCTPQAVAGYQNATRHCIAKAFHLVNDKLEDQLTIDFVIFQVRSLARQVLDQLLCS